jgi:hypothetical protein
MRKLLTTFASLKIASEFDYIQQFGYKQLNEGTFKDDSFEMIYESEASKKKFILRYPIART